MKKLILFITTFLTLLSLLSSRTSRLVWSLASWDFGECATLCAKARDGEARLKVKIPAEATTAKNLVVSPFLLYSLTFYRIMLL